MSRLPSLRSVQPFESFGRLGSAIAAAELDVTVGAISQQSHRPPERPVPETREFSRRALLHRAADRINYLAR